jgi:hypothetical protein
LERAVRAGLYFSYLLFRTKRDAARGYTWPASDCRFLPTTFPTTPA